MKRLLIVWLLVSLTLGLSLYFGRDFFAELLRQKIESSAKTAGVQLRIGHLSLSWLPLGLQFENVHVEIPQMMSGDLKEFKILCALDQVFDRRLGLQLELRDGAIQWLLVEAETPSASVDPSQPQGPKSALPVAIGLQVLGQRFSVKVMKAGSSVAAVQVSEIKVATATLMDPKSPLRIDFIGDVEAVAMKIPTQIHVPALFISDSNFKGEKIDVAVLGLTSQWNLAGSLDGSQVKADGQLSVADLKTIPKTAFVKGVESLEGSLSAQVRAEIRKPGPPAVTAVIKSPQFAVLLNRREGAQMTKGPVRGAVDVSVVYQQNQLQVRKSEVRLDLQDLDLEVAPYFHKIQGVPFAVEAAMEGNQEQLSVSKLELHLADAVLASRLVIKDALRDAHVQFETELQPVELKQLGQLSPMVGKFPLTGQMAAKASGNILAKEPLRGQIQLQRLSLKNVRGAIDLEKPAFKTKGPFRLNLEASSFIQAGAVKKLDAKGEFSHGPIQLKFAGAIKDLHSFVGQFVGQITSIDAVLRMLPSLTNPKMEGVGDFKIQVAGPLELAKSPLEWPLKTSGDVHLKLAKIQFDKAPPQTPVAAAATAQSKVGVSVKPFLEKHKLYEGLSLSFNSEVTAVEMDQLQLQGLRLKAAVSAQGLRGDFSVAQVFGGRISVSDMSVNPFQTKPFFSGEIEFARLNVTSALKLLKPEFASMVSGLAEGKMSISSSDPRTETFLEDLRAGGQMVLAQALIKSLPLVEMAQGILSKIPGAVQAASAQAKDVPMTARMSFQLASKVATLKPFHAVTERQDELNLNGTVNLEMLANLHGDFKLAQPPVGGSFLAANQDEKGRLVLPLSIEGSLLSPKVAFVGSTLDKMARNTLEYEKNKAIKKATESVKKSVEDEVKKQLKGIFGQ